MLLYYSFCSSKLADEIAQTKELIDTLQEEVELLEAEDRLMEKGFRKDFHDIHGPVNDIIHKAYKRRPK